MDQSLAHLEYESEADLLDELNRNISDPNSLEYATNYVYNTMVEEMIVGIVFEIHYLDKTGVGKAITGNPEDRTVYPVVDRPGLDIFGSTATRKPIDFLCPNCERPVASARFAPHLEKCKGIGRGAARLATRRNAKDGNNYYSSVTDDEEDADWSTDKKKKKLQSTRTNGSKKSGKSAN